VKKNGAACLNIMTIIMAKNIIFEEIAVKHRLDGNIADDDGRNGKQNQRQGNDQRAFVRIVVFAQAVMSSMPTRIQPCTS
jgi:hypothetical protein